MSSAPYDREQDERPVERRTLDVTTTPVYEHERYFSDPRDRQLYHALRLPGGLNAYIESQHKSNPDHFIEGSTSVRKINRKDVQEIGRAVSTTSNVVVLVPVHERDTKEIPVVATHNDDLGNIA